MELLTFIFSIALLVGGGMAIWLNTKSGKHWAENL